MVRTDLKKSVKAEELEETDSRMVTVVIGYLGSVDIPAAANLPTASLQAIRGCVRRLRVEQRIHSLMVMNIDPSGIRLLNASSQVTVMYPANKIVFSGICPDDKRCFGVVTVQNAAVGQTPDLDDEEPIGSACHVFIIDPELSSHQMHEEISLQFGLDCTPAWRTTPAPSTRLPPVSSCITYLSFIRTGRITPTLVTSTDRRRMSASPAGVTAAAATATADSATGVGTGCTPTAPTRSWTLHLTSVTRGPTARSPPVTTRATPATPPITTPTT
ncbi:putative regulator of G-protein signaling 12 isoform X1 [Apostichopus japonicus]|uniref:Putative regulator of G-protein signaling 12 isoform X1 n=1 Tax=Stichopus japonicus TaxID=307972 RepID=A0A2G8LGG2_STIJA|nr:putative regulator of G-protein signaling 12 isoform X1 [Apostichopus japonicus]